MSSRKFFGNILIFTVLILLNLFIVFKYFARQQKIAAMNTLISEIDTARLTQTPTTSEEEEASEVSDVRIANLKAFFRTHSSPLYDHAEYIVKTSDKYGLDYRLIPAIAMKESTLCQAIPPNSHNCWGWGIYGSTITRFSSYDEAISTVAQGLKKNYIDQGLTTPERIMAKYTGHPENNTWASGVNSVLRWLE